MKKIRKNSIDRLFLTKYRRSCDRIFDEFATAESGLHEEEIATAALIGSQCRHMLLGCTESLVAEGREDPACR